MESLQYILQQIPVRHNLASHLMFLGIVQGVFLSFVILFHSKKGSATVLFGWALLVQCLVFTDTYLCYTGLIKYILHFNDSTEVFVLLIAPTIYFFIYALLERKPITFKKHWPHFLLPLLYGLSQINYYLAPIEVKLNAYLGAYYNNLGYVSVPDSFSYSFQKIKDEFRWMILFSLLFYIILAARLVFKAKSKKTFSPKNIKVDKYTFSRNTVVIFSCLLIFIFLIFLNYDDDGGDHYIGILQAIITFTTSFFIISESRFFEKSWIADKYETLTSGSILFDDIEKCISEDDRFLNENMSLKNLAEKLDSNTNLVSKLINSETGTNFNDYLNQKRIIIAKDRLIDNKYSHLTIEAIGLSVGFKSKSAFYTAFKKHTSTSPSMFMKQKTV